MNKVFNVLIYECMSIYSCDSQKVKKIIQVI